MPARRGGGAEVQRELWEGESLSCLERKVPAPRVGTCKCLPGEAVGQRCLWAALSPSPFSAFSRRVCRPPPALPCYHALTFSGKLVPGTPRQQVSGPRGATSTHKVRVIVPHC